MTSQLGLQIVAALWFHGRERFFKIVEYILNSMTQSKKLSENLISLWR